MIPPSLVLFNRMRVNNLKKKLPEAEMKLRLALDYLQIQQEEKNKKNETYLL